MATHDAFTDCLSDYLDDEDLGDSERREIARTSKAAPNAARRCASSAR